ncbi:MAG: VOC family protein [Kofleriaceae bacterium]|nr:VOC family protein [Kofleriaceae bacterium]
MTNNTNKYPVINWFEIPVSDLAKSTRLYEAMLDIKLLQIPGVQHAIFKGDNLEGTGGALVVDPKRKPGTTGTTIYLNARDGVDRALARAVEAGAKVVMPPTSIAPNGTIALIEDLDGNLIGLHTEPSA